MFEIRRMSLADYAEVYQLWVDSSGVGLNELDDSAEGIRRYLLRNPDTCFVAIIDGSIEGAILSGHDGRRGFIYHLSVNGSMHRHGIGTALVARALDALRNEGIHKVALVVMKNNEIGNAFWDKIGFVVRPDLIYRNSWI